MSASIVKWPRGAYAAAASEWHQLAPTGTETAATTTASTDDACSVVATASAAGVVGRNDHSEKEFRNN